MRRFQKEQLVKSIDMLREAGEEMAKQPVGSQKINLCADMQELILAILNFAESIAVKDTELSDLLSEVYIMLLKASQEEVPAEEIVRQLETVASCVSDRMDIDKMEVAFFCPRADISQCLESIYLDIEKYDTCDTYFVPIPYYDKRQDGSLGEMHYESGRCYPDQFKQTDWRRYDAKKRHPDIMFIVDPYDEYGREASVHPDFYASRLRESTDLLVYVDNGGSNRISSGDIQKMPGILLSDKIVVQSEDMREEYIRMLLGQGIVRGEAEKKVITFDALNIV